MRKGVFVALAIAALLGGQTAVAGPPSKWTRVTDPTGRNIDQVGLVRTADGVLHVAWLRKNGSNTDIVHTPVTGATVGTATPIQTAWGAVTNPTLVTAPDGTLRAVFAGIRTTDVKDPYSEGTVYVASADASGAAWTLLPGAVAAHSAAYVSDTIGAHVLADGNLVTGWGSAPGTFVHVGSNSAVANQLLQSSCCGYQPAIAADSVSGEVVMAWYSNASDGQGHFAQAVWPALGARALAPGSVTTSGGKPQSLNLSGRAAISGRTGASGVYLAYGKGYPKYTCVLLWRHGTPAPQVSIPFKTVTSQRGPDVALGRGPAGRLWVAWSDGDRLYATRTNRAVTTAGPVTTIVPPKGMSNIWQVAADGAPGLLDLFASVTTPGSLATWHTQVRPVLSFSAKPSKVATGATTKVTLTVTDAGDPVPGAKVKLAGKTATTNAQGKAALSVAPAKKGVLTAAAALSGYSKAAAKIVVK